MSPIGFLLGVPCGATDPKIEWLRIVIFLTVDPSRPACHRRIAGFPALFGTVAMLKVISGSVLWEHSVVT